jgi:hypothetical protein
MRLTSITADTGSRFRIHFILFSQCSFPRPPAASARSAPVVHFVLCLLRFRFSAGAYSHSLSRFRRPCMVSVTKLYLWFATVTTELNSCVWYGCVCCRVVICDIAAPEYYNTYSHLAHESKHQLALYNITHRTSLSSC